MRSTSRALVRVVEGGALACSATLSGCLMARPARTAPLPLPHALTVVPVRFASPSGSTIRAWYARGDPGKGAVLLLHGVGSNRASMVDRAAFLHRAGYTVLLPDFQAHGESDGAHITFGSLESLDAGAALAFLRECAAGEPVAVIGVSMGGAAALLGHGPLRADAFVLESVYPTIREAVEGRLGVWLGPLGWLNRWIAPLLIRGVGAEIGVAENDLRPIDHIADADAPVFVLSGTRDSYTPIAEARALFAQARAPKEFWAVKGAAHEDLYAFAGAAYEQRVGSFLATYLRAAPHRVATATEATAPSCGGATRRDPT